MGDRPTLWCHLQPQHTLRGPGSRSRQGCEPLRRACHPRSRGAHGRRAYRQGADLDGYLHPPHLRGQSMKLCMRRLKGLNSAAISRVEATTARVDSWPDRLAAQWASVAYARESASGTGTFLFSSGGAGGRPVTSRISSSSRVSRSNRARASASSSLRCSARSRRASEVQYWCLLLAANGITLFSLVDPFGFSR